MAYDPSELHHKTTLAGASLIAKGMGATLATEQGSSMPLDTYVEGLTQDEASTIVCLTPAEGSSGVRLLVHPYNSDGFIETNITIVEFSDEAQQP